MKPKKFFQKAVAVWPEGLAGQMNVRVSLHAKLQARHAQEITVRVAGATAFRLWINGNFLAYGPARAAHGFARIDEYKIPESILPQKGREETLWIVLELSDYGVPTFLEARGKAFCCAELGKGKRVVAWTGSPSGGFAAERREEAIQRIERYSYQRGFCEGYRLDRQGEQWRQAGYIPQKPLALIKISQPRTWIERGMAYPAFQIHQPRRLKEFGVALLDRRKLAKARTHRFLHDVPQVSKGYLLSERGWPLYETMAGLRFSSGGPRSAQLGKGKWMRVDFGLVQTGFPKFQIKAGAKTRLVAIFDEILIDGHIQFDRLESLNAIWLDLPSGTRIDFEAFEPYVLRYLQIIVLDGSATITKVSLRDYASAVTLSNSPPGIAPALQKVRRAALASFRQNALDLYMDCPSRERAGWLCDSFFTARAEWHLTGDNPVERAFLENYLRPKTFVGLPKGMVPMCYPAEPLEGVFIPNWAMFLVLQLADARRHRRLPASWSAMIDHRVRGLLSYFKKFENELGLLENLESWVFVEWSEAQSFVQGINFPSNMLYAAMLDEAAYLLGEKPLSKKAGLIRNNIRALSWKDGRFSDQAKRRIPTEIIVEKKASEVCQYYAFFFGLESPASKPELWSRLIREDYGDLFPANAFIGKLLRLDLLVMAGEYEAAWRELKKTYAPMARKTGTLWEHVDPRASCNHGFTSYIAVLMDRMASARSFTRVRAMDSAFLSEDSARPEELQTAVDGPSTGHRSGVPNSRKKT